MASSSSRNWMWAEALDMLAQAERLHRQFFEPLHSAMHAPQWQPPVDVLETESELLVLAALPGVDAATVKVVIDGATLLISGYRPPPAELMRATIHRLEIPQGRFQRAVPLPPGRYGAVSRAHLDGCLLVTLNKVRRVGEPT